MKIFMVTTLALPQKRIYFLFWGNGFFSVLHIGDLGVKYSSIKN